MGNCCGAPSSQGGGGKNRRRKEKPNPFKAAYNRAALARAGLVVLWDPTGRNLGAAGHALGGELGRGEFGVTYLCTDAATGARMACKSNSKCKLRTPVDVEDVRREVEIMRHMPPNHNIGSLSATYEDEDAVHIIMELCEGGELFDRIVARGHYTEREPSSRWSSRRLRSSSLEPCRGRTRCRRTSSPGQWRLLGYLVTPGPQRPCLLPEHSPAAGGTAWRRTLPACSVSAAET